MARTSQDRLRSDAEQATTFRPNDGVQGTATAQLAPCVMRIPLPGGVARYRGAVGALNRRLAEEGPFFERLPRHDGAAALAGGGLRGTARAVRGRLPWRSA